MFASSIIKMNVEQALLIGVEFTLVSRIVNKSSCFYFAFVTVDLYELGISKTFIKTNNIAY